MNLETTKKQLLTIGASILIAVIASGIWDIAVKPSGYWLVKTILSIATLGSGTIKDSVYLDAAKGYHEEPSILLLSALASSVLSIPLWMGVAIFTARNRIMRAMKRTKKNTGPGSSLDTESVDSLVRRAERLFKLSYALIAVMTVLLTFIVVGMMKAEQADTAYTFFQQELRICRPYLEERQALLIESQFARVQTRADYIAITDELRQVAADHQLGLPKYSPW